MRGIVALAALAGGVLVATGADRVASVAHESTRTVWDSVYTDSQSARGDSLYGQSCGRCHGAGLAGTDSGLPLTGKDFLANWNGLTAGDLHDRMRGTMPPDNPRSISRQQVTDILAYLFARNHFPSGGRPLPSDADPLQDIKIVANRPH